jgi:integrase
MRVGEAVSLTWGDVDAAGQRLRLRSKTTKRDRARWVHLPGWLVDAIEATCPLEDRTPERRVSQGCTESSAYTAMSRALQGGEGSALFAARPSSPAAVIWHQQGVPAREVAHRAGHSRTSESLDAYTHVMPLDELPADALGRLSRRETPWRWCLGGVQPRGKMRKPAQAREVRLATR